MKPNKHISDLRFMAVTVLGSFALLASSALIQYQQSLTSSTDNRAAASESKSPVEFRVTTSPSDPKANADVIINFQINTHNYNVSSFQFLNTSINNPNNYSIPATLYVNKSTLEIWLNKIESNKLSFVAVTPMQSPLNTGNNFETMASFKLTPATAGSISFAFSSSEVIATEDGGNDTNIAVSPSPVSITIGEAGSSATPTPTPTPNTSTSTTTTTTTTSCDMPTIPQSIKTITGSKDGEIKVSWTAADRVDHYAVSFGTKPGKYEWGSSDIGNIREFVIRFLNPGQTYYVVVSAVNGCGGSAYSAEAHAKASGTSTIAAKTTTTKPTTTPKPKVVGLTDEGEEIEPTPAPTSTPTPTASTETTTTSTNADKTLLDRLFPWLLLILGIIIGLILRPKGNKKTAVITPVKSIPDYPVYSTKSDIDELEQSLKQSSPSFSDDTSVVRQPTKDYSEFPSLTSDTTPTPHTQDPNPVSQDPTEPTNQSETSSQ